MFYEKTLMFKRWAAEAKAGNEVFLDGVSMSSRHMTRMPKTESRRLLRSSVRREHDQLSSLVDRLRSIAEQKATTRPRTLERWSTNSSALAEKTRLNTMLALGATRITDIVKGSLRNTWNILRRGRFPITAPWKDPSYTVSKEWGDKFLGEVKAGGV
jgi:hypothetical protein